MALLLRLDIYCSMIRKNIVLDLAERERENFFVLDLAERESEKFFVMDLAEAMAKRE